MIFERSRVSQSFFDDGTSELIKHFTPSPTSSTLPSEGGHQHPAPTTRSFTTQAMDFQAANPSTQSFENMKLSRQILLQISASASFRNSQKAREQGDAATTRSRTSFCTKKA